MDLAKAHLLQKYNLSPGAWLGKGMESDVYARDADTVLKLYSGTVRLTHLTALQQFYDSLDRQQVPYQLPQIHEVAQEGDTLITIEQRLYGTNLGSILGRLSAGELEQVMERYLTAVCALSAVKMPTSTDRYRLFDSEGISKREDGDWHRFLDRYLTLKLIQLTPYLSRDVDGFAGKVAQLRAILAQPNEGELCLIHGDFFPGNLLVDDELQVKALLDFGLMTMYGDALFDVATSWVFFDMYDSLKVDVRGRYLNMVLARLGEEVRGKLYRYVLFYSMVGANAYSQQCADGHYQWCVVNLNHRPYWDHLK